MSDILASPVLAALLTIGGSAAFAVLGLVIRLSNKVDRLSDAVKSIRHELMIQKTDSNVVRWSDIRDSGGGKRRNGR